MGCRVFVWLGGDVTQYVVVNYRMYGSGYVAKSFTSAAYLVEVLGVEKAVVIVPETLFEKDHCRFYRLLLEAKSGFGSRRLYICGRDGGCRDVTTEDRLVHKLLEKGFDCYVVPHPGLATPLSIAIDSDRVEVYRGSAKQFPDYGFNLVFDSIYRVLSRYANQVESGGDSICIDVTHGTNLLVSATLLAASLIPIVYGVDVKIYAAPVMTRPERGTVVSVLELSDAVNAVKEVIAGAQAWSKLDERLMNVEYYRSVGAKLGYRYRDLYSGIESVLRSGKELLWGLRSGQIPVVRSYVEDLRSRLRDAEKRLRDILMKELPIDDQPHQDTWREHCGEPPWATIASTCIVLINRLLSELKEDTNLGFMMKALDKLLDVGYPDKVIGVGRELMTIVNALKKGLTELRVGDDVWRRLEEEMRERNPVFDRARAFRNKLMHGRISKEENVVVKIRDRDVELYSHGKPPRLIERREVEEVAKELMNMLRSMLGGENV